MSDLTESTPQLYALIFYLIHPSQIEGWEPQAETDPDTVEGESHLSTWEDERNSRPFPY